MESKLSESKYIDANLLRKKVLKWLPSDPCGIEGKEMPFQTDICVSMLMEIEEAPVEEVVPVVHAHWELIQDGIGICSHCHRQDKIDPLAKYCRYCGAKIGSKKEEW